MKYPSLPCKINIRKFEGSIDEKNLKHKIADALFRQSLDEAYLERINSYDEFSNLYADDDYVYKVYNEALKIIEKEKVIKQLSYIEINSEKAEVYKKIREEFANGLEYRDTAYKLVNECGYKAEDVEFVEKQLKMQEEAMAQAELNAEIDFVKRQNEALQMQIKQLERKLAEKTSSSVVVQQAASAPVQWEYMALDGWDLSSYAGRNSNALEGLNKLGREGWEPVDDFYVSTGINDTNKRVYKRIRRD